MPTVVVLFRSFLVVLAVVSTVWAATPGCEAYANEEACQDAFMHPDLSTFEMEGQSDVDSAADNAETEQTFWLQNSREHIRTRINSEPIRGKAKNIILFLGDGMGLTTLTAARNLIGGENQHLAFEKFPYTGLSKTYSVDKIVADSACTATAYLCGVKANYGTIGVNGKVERDDCDAMANTANHVFSIAKWAMDEGKSAGLVTTTRVTHASPAGVYAHTADRDWENDDLLKKSCGETTQLKDIAQQLIDGEVGSKLKLVMGGGKAEFLDTSVYTNGLRKDGKDLVKEYLDKSPKNAYVETKEELFSLNLSNYERLMALFQDDHMDFHLEAVADAKNTQPTLEEMTRKAIEFMQTEENGYFLFIEGGKIDMGHHYTYSRIALDETVELSKAVEAARSLTSEEDTLIVVTADHSHTFSVAGYPARGSDIFGVAPSSGSDGKKYFPISYANGPSFDTFYDTVQHERRDPEPQQMKTPRDYFPSTVPLAKETHGGEDVPVFASGPWSELFAGVYDQHAIPHMMAYASCIGNGLRACAADTPHKNRD